MISKKRGHDLKRRNMTELRKAFATPMDREDIYRAITSIDQIMNDAKTIVREMEILSLTPDHYTLEMAQLLLSGVHALKLGYHHLRSTPAQVGRDAEVVRKAERNTEKTYRRAIASLFRADALTILVDSQTPMESSQLIAWVTETFKRRELYRHMSNMADQLARAGDVMLDIAIQI